LSADHVAEATLEDTDTGVVATGDGWFVLNARDARWRRSDTRGAVCAFDEQHEFAQVGVNLYVLGPGQPMSMYHWEADQEDFLVLGGEALLIVEGEERPLRRWDFVHCPAGAKHTIVGAGSGPCAIVAVGARERSTGPPGSGWGGYTVDEIALRHDAGVAAPTDDPQQAYAHVEHRRPARYEDGWLPGA
jgi:quercetin dioxygenase-like cupin family protein